MCSTVTPHASELATTMAMLHATEGEPYLFVCTLLYHDHDAATVTETQYMWLLFCLDDDDG